MYALIVDSATKPEEIDIPELAKTKCVPVYNHLSNI
jgi:hypothetical protein